MNSPIRRIAIVGAVVAAVLVGVATWWFVVQDASSGAFASGVGKCARSPDIGRNYDAVSSGNIVVSGRVIDSGYALQSFSDDDYVSEAYDKDSEFSHETREVNGIKYSIVAGGTWEATPTGSDGKWAYPTEPGNQCPDTGIMLFVGDEVVDGVKARHYRVAPVPVSYEAFDGRKRDLWDVWVNEDGWMIQAKLDRLYEQEDGSILTYKITVKLSDFGVPNNIESPIVGSPR